MPITDPATALFAGAEALRLRTNGIVLNAVAAGPANGQPVVLLHGFPEFWYGWRHQIKALAAAGLRVIAPDQRGYNLSDKPKGTAAYNLDELADDILGLVAALGHERFAVVGHDWGAIVAWHLAGRNPEQVTRAVILNGPHLPTFRRYLHEHRSQARKSWYVAAFRCPVLPELALRTGNFAFMRRALVRSSRPGTFTAADWSVYEVAWKQSGALTAMLNWYRAVSLPAIARELERIRVPVRVIWGDRDVFLEPGLAEASVAMCDQGEVIHLPSATHWVQHEEPEAVNRMLIEFLR